MERIGSRLRFQALFMPSCLVLAGLLLLAACSGGSGGGAGGQPTVAAKASQPTAQPPAAQPTQAPAQKAGAPTAAPPAAKVSIDACSLLTKQEVEAATGKTVLEPKPEGSGASVACQYNDSKDFHVVSLIVLIGTDAKDAKDAYDMGKSRSGGAPSVAGLGDDAYWVEMMSTLEVLKGRYDISVAVAPDAKDPQGAAKDLAAKVLSRLP